VIDARFEPAPLEVWKEDFAAVANSMGVLPQDTRPEEAEISEAHAARFVLTLLRQKPALRRRFRRPLSELERAGFYRWLVDRGAREFGLSSSATKKIRSLFRRRWGKKIRDIYLNDPELQKLYPLGLLPIGQHDFLGWLSTHGRIDQGLTDEQIIWFLYDSTEDIARSLVFTYLLQPAWQKKFPSALEPPGWKEFRRWIIASYGNDFVRALPLREPPVVPGPDHGWRKRSRSFFKRRAQVPEGVNILSHFCNPSGIQQAALWTKAALERGGLRTSCRDVPVPRRVAPSDREQWLGLEIFPVTILTHAATPYFESGYDRSGLFARENVYRIAYWAWELESVPDDWVKAAELVEEIWSPTRFVAEAMRARMSRPVYHMLPGVEIGPVEKVTRTSLNIPENHFVFLFMFDLHSQLHRKNPGAVFRAFRAAFRDDDRATLVIKTSGGDIHSTDMELLRETIRGQNVILLDRLMTRAQAYGLIDMCDCFVSLHRSEGFGLGLAEAMLMAKPVIATGYSGNLDFMNRDNSFLVDYERVEIKEDRPIYTRGNVWAEPSIEQAAGYMREVYEHRDEARARAQRTQAETQSLLSLEAAGKRMRARLDQIATFSSSSMLPLPLG
jgi:glycosyltransferase involved in cell wall biosynthesis